MSSFAQTTVTGTITDIDNNPLFGVEVYASDLHRGTITDEHGRYELTNLPNGSVKLSFSYLGFQTLTKKLNITGKPLVVNILLKESIYTIDEVIISTPFNKLQSENVMKVERMTAAALKRTGAPTLINGLASISGVSQISTGASIGKPVIRGLSGNRVLVYAQGVRLENQQFGDEHGLGISDEGIESIEVIKGPASLLYGSDALGGVIYINPEKFATANQSSFLFGQRYFSNTLGSNTSLGYKKSTDRWKFLARATANNHSDYKVPSGEKVTNTRFREQDFKLGLGYNSTNYSSEIRYNFNGSLLGITEGIGAQSNYTTPMEPYQQIDNHIFSMHNHFFFGNSKLDVDLGYLYNDRNEFEEEHGHDDHDDHDDDEDHDEHDEDHEGPALRMKLKTFNYNIKYHLARFSNEVDVIFGLQGMHQTNKNFGEELLIPDAKINDVGMFGTVNYSWNSSSIQAGIRFDNRSLMTEYHEVVHETEVHVFEALDKDYNSFTASLGYKFAPFKNTTIRINAATGFRAPNLAELTSNGVHHGTNRFELGNANLETEKNIQADLAIEYQTEHLELFVNAFHNTLNDYIYLSPTGAVEDGAPVYNYTQNNAKLYGGEIGFHLHPHPVDWLHLQSSYEMVIGKQSNGDYLPLIPANIIKNTLRTEFDIKNWLQNGYATLSLNSTFTQKNVSQFETNTSSYNLVDLGFGGAISLGELKFNGSLSITNLLDTNYINHLSRLKSDGILNSGRNIVLGVNFNI
ncbi:TonB-dependent receptor [Polaribacter pacificus]|uniref:TonB-dependent receptor n=2 Tax=Polaribacter pacificus TaxID=1775173 RepID=A0A917MDS8_9FLAO|nr:TonB-dependent receptor [Polaribacter pacificus]